VRAGMLLLTPKREAGLSGHRESVLRRAGTSDGDDCCRSAAEGPSVREQAGSTPGALNSGPPFRVPSEGSEAGTRRRTSGLPMRLANQEPEVGAQAWRRRGSSSTVREPERPAPGIPALAWRATGEILCARSAAGEG
jgi:hypothetical protein